MHDRITPVLLTYNEENNLERTMARLDWAKDIVVVDSGSTDGTLDIVKRFPQVRIYQRPFQSHADQWNFATTATDIRTDWILRLDADYVLSAELVRELASLDPDAPVNGYEIGFDYAIGGKALTGALYPANVILFRRGFASVEQAGHTERWAIKPPIGALQARVMHDDRKSSSAWFTAQQRYSRLEAETLLKKPRTALSRIERIRLMAFPLPILVFFYVLLVKRCIFDGRAGLIYAWQRLVAEAMIALQILELRSRQSGATP